ncbi:MAG TPA: exopolysaccharide biosynthesis protein [Polyangiaceae bacterium]|nr:exopolysaccharide biosynthesis protein [Polyangiaceae bacterium]
MTTCEERDLTETDPPAPARRRMSGLLRSLASEWPGERLTLGDLENALGDRSFGVLLLVLSIPALVPGVATVATVPLVLLGLQLALGHATPWMPAFVRRRAMAKADFARIVRRVAPLVERVERYLRPRPSLLVAPAGERLVGALCAVLAALLPVPLPFGNAIVVVPIMVLALGLVERDGQVALAGFFLGVACATLFVMLTWATLRGSLHLASHYMGHFG